MRIGTTIILSRNDLEADEIVKVARANSCQTIDLALNWPKLPDFSLSKIEVDDLPSQVILVECPSPEFEERLRRTGRTVHVVDHHVRSRANGELIDRRSLRTSLEQVMHILGKPEMSEDQRYVAANDAGYWPGLIDLASRLDTEDNENFVEQQKLQSRHDISVSNGTILEKIRKVRALELARDHTGNDEERLAAGLARLDRALATFRAALDAGAVARLTPFRFAKKKAHEFILITCSEADAGDIIDGAWLHLALEVVESGQPIEELNPEFMRLTVEKAAPKRVTGLFFSGSPSRASETADLFQRLKSTIPDSTIDLYAGGGVRSSFIDIRSSDFNLSKTADMLLDELLDGERPIWSWRSHFLQFLQYTGDALVVSDLAKKGLRRIWPTNAERVYLSKQIRGHWAIPPTGNDQSEACIDPNGLELSSFEIDLATAEIRLRWKTDLGEEMLSSGKLRLRLHFAPLGVIMIEWIAEGAPVAQFGGPELTWWALLQRWSALPQGHIGTIAELLRFNESARYIFSPFKNPGEARDLEFEMVTSGGKRVTSATTLGIAAAADEPLNKAWFGVLLDHVRGLLGIGAEQLEAPTDARSRVITGVSTLGGQPLTTSAILRQDNILARLAGVDGYSPSFFYEPNFARQELEAWRYRRFANQGTHIAIHGYAFAVLTSGWFGTNLIVGPPHSDRNTDDARHISHDYWRLFTLGAAQSAILGNLTRRLGEMSSKRLSLEGADRDKFAEDAHTLREKINSFSHAFWTDEASTEMQGRDLYNIILRQVGVRDARERLVAEVERLDQAELLEQAERTADGEARFDAIVLSIGAVIGAWSLFEWLGGSLAGPDAGPWWRAAGALLVGFFIAMRLVRKRAADTGQNLLASVIADATEVLRLVAEFLGLPFMRKTGRSRKKQAK